MDNDINISKWDTASFLKNQEDIEAYLQVAFETGDPKQITKALGNVARAQCIQEPDYKNSLANENPTLQTITTVMAVLGYRLAIVPSINKYHTV